VYDLTRPEPAIPIAVLNNPSPAPEDGFGQAVAVSGTRVVVGAYQDDTGGADAGSVYVYDLASADPTVPVTILNNPRPGEFGYFGISVNISGSRVAVGAERHDYFEVSNPGIVYLYDLTSATPAVPLRTIENPNPNKGDAFGRSVAMEGPLLAVGAPGDDTVGADKGSVYVFRDIMTAAPVLDSPSSGALTRSPVSVSFNLPEPALPGSVKLDFNDGIETRTLTLATSMEGQGQHSFGFNPANPTAAPEVATGAAIPDGVYSVTLSFQDIGANPAATASTANVTIDTTPPALTFPASVTVEAASASGAIVNYSASATDVNGVLNFSSLPASGSIFPLGPTQVNVSATDTAGNASTGNFVVTVQDTTAPSIGGVFSPLMTFVGALPDYTSQAVASDAVGVVSVVQSPAPGTVTSVGVVQVTLTATDAAGNHGSTTFDVAIRPLNPASVVMLAEGEPPPGAGAENGPPAESAITSFGVPAIDSDGTIAFTARWISASGKGGGIFTSGACLAKTGDEAAGLNGGRWAVFSDPLISEGQVVFRASASGPGSRKSEAIVNCLPGVEPAVLGQTGQDAEGTNGAKFRRFQGYAVSNQSVAVMAQLLPESGSPKVDLSNDVGLWLQDNNNPLTLVLREGQTVDGKTIRTLKAFKSGNGSPGQGRGWLVSVDGIPEALAAITFTDRSQAIVKARIDGEVSIVSASGEPGDLGPDIDGASFKSFSVPATTGSGSTAFAASLTIGPGVTKSNSRGVFLGGDGIGYTAIARIGTSIGEENEVVTVMKDPVITDESSIAFPALLARNNAVTAALLWKAGNEPLRLLAKAGQPAAELPAGAAWKSFPSLGIAAGRGPMFVANLAPGRGGVTRANATGVWATDFTGALRLLFRTGDVFVGRNVKNFTVLSAASGSKGVTRSFNASGQVVWRATFTDRSSAIVQTDIP
jgi:hypothetical protein